MDQAEGHSRPGLPRSGHDSKGLAALAEYRRVPGPRGDPVAPCGSRGVREEGVEGGSRKEGGGGGNGGKRIGREEKEEEGKRKRRSEERRNIIRREGEEVG